MKRIQIAPKENQVRLLLDSGAYSAWSRDQSIDVRDYIEFCKDNADLIWRMINLDVIPGKFRIRSNTQDEVERSASSSYRNLQRMKEAGLKPIPVFHMGERLWWLERLLEDGETYIGLSLNKFVSLREQIRWLNTIFSILTDKEGRPLVRTHGFAATSFPLMINYPWQSVDSTTWSLTPGYGQIIIPAMIADKFDYLHPPTRVIMSGIEQQNKNAQTRQFEALPPKQKQMVERYIVEVVGSTIVGQRYSSIERCKAMLTYYVQLCKHLYDVRFKARSVSISGPGHFNTRNLKPRRPWNMILSFATEAMHKEWAHIMNETGANDRLLSYWNLRDRPDDTLRKFVRNGACGEWVPSKTRADFNKETYTKRRRLALFERISEGSTEDAQD